MYWCETWIFSWSSTRWRGWEKLTGLAWEMAFFCSGIGWISAEVLLHSILVSKGNWMRWISGVCDVTCFQFVSTNKRAHQMQQEFESFWMLQTDQSLTLPADFLQTVTISCPGHRWLRQHRAGETKRQWIWCTQCLLKGLGVNRTYIFSTYRIQHTTHSRKRYKS